MPAQLSEPQVPVAKAQISVELGMTLVTGWTVPVTAERCKPVLKSALMVTSLYTANMKAPGGRGVGVGVGWGVGVGVGVVPGPPAEQETPVTPGSPVPAGPAFPGRVGSWPMFQNWALKFMPFLLATLPPLQVVVAVLQ